VHARAIDWEGNSHPLPNPPQRFLGDHGGQGSEMFYIT
jgi:hypothetical protein